MNGASEKEENERQRKSRTVGLPGEPTAKSVVEFCPGKLQGAGTAEAWVLKLFNELSEA